MLFHIQNLRSPYFFETFRHRAPSSGTGPFRYLELRKERRSALGLHDSGHTPPYGLEMAVEQTARPQMTVKRTLRPETGMNSI